MNASSERAVNTWLLTVSVLIVLMVLLGGYVRLTRSGLSIVEWKPISGVVPPIGESAWQAEFAKYQQTPEYQKVNTHFSLEEYKRIFYVEYIHRLIARIAGLIVVLPLFYFLWKQWIPWRKSGIYWLIAALFGFQGFLGWYMVSSGLENRPAVSHFRLTIHLLTALALLALTLWVALNRMVGERDWRHRGELGRGGSFGWTWAMLGLLILQIAYGGLVAGLKAGHVSNTWPLMFGYWIPPGLLSVVQPWWRNLFETMTTVHYVHRWLAFLVLFAAIWVWVRLRQAEPGSVGEKAILLMLGLSTLQIVLGVSVIWFSVPIWLALWHQGNALLMVVNAIYLIHHLSAPKAGEVVAHVLRTSRVGA